MRRPKPLPPLTSAQQEIAIQQLPHAYSIAHTVWRTSLLPAFMLDEMKGEAELILCQCLSRQQTPQGKAVLCGIQIRKRLIELIQRYRVEKGFVLLEREIVVEHDNNAEETAGRSLSQAFDRLTPLQQQVLAMRYGLDGKGVKGVSEIGRKLGVGPAAVSGCEQRALATLRRIWNER